jgi:hypothetical protein
MRPVSSAGVVAVGYDDQASSLYVEFVGGDTYVYSLVPRSTFERLMAASSKGTFVNKVVKPRYPCRRV